MFAYDAENRLTTVTQPNGSGQYAYDAQGRRIKSVANGVTTWFLYDARGRLLQEYSGVPPGITKVYYYLGQEIGATYDNTYLFRFWVRDPLGSVRMISGNTRTPPFTPTVHSRRDFLPFGGAIPVEQGRVGLSGYETDAGEKHKFTGQERDGESGLDYFATRYYANAFERFMSVDPKQDLEKNSKDPQRWNLYSYALNNPLANTDVDGRESRAAQMLDQDVRALARGEITAEEYNQRLQARAAGAVAGAAGVAGFYAPELVAGAGAALTKVGNAISGLFDRLGEAAIRFQYSESGVLRFSNSKALGQEITRLEDKVANNMSALDQRHIGAALRELAGEVVKINERTGKPFDHVTEVRNAAQGLINATGRIRQLLGDPNLTQKTRSALEATLRQANEKLKEVKDAGLLP